MSEWIKERSCSLEAKHTHGERVWGRAVYNLLFSQHRRTGSGGAAGRSKCQYRFEQPSGLLFRVAHEKIEKKSNCVSSIFGIFQGSQKA